jgi:hypothetical protein
LGYIFLYKKRKYFILRKLEKNFIPIFRELWKKILYLSFANCGKKFYTYLSRIVEKNFMPIFRELWKKILYLSFANCGKKFYTYLSRIVEKNFIPIFRELWKKIYWLFPNIIATLLQYFLNILFFCYILAIAGG